MFLPNFLGDFDFLRERDMPHVVAASPALAQE